MKQHHQQFGPDRYAFLFLPGDYSKMKTINVGYYTQVLGLGRSPLDVKLPNVKTPCALPNNNATCNFWVGIENVTITEKENNEDPYFAFQWAVSQAAPARRLYVERKAVFDWFYGWASGGYVADTVFKKPAGYVVASAYPGTPSTEILENIAKFKDTIKCEWAVNEKVAVETAIGASMAGARALTASL